MRVLQEFYCGNCRHYFTAKLNVSLNHEVMVRCPGCGHEHHRCIVNGVIKEQGRGTSKVAETVVASKASLSDKPVTQAMMNATGYNSRRDGVVLSEQETAAIVAGSLLLAESWQNKAESDKGDY